MQKHKTQKHKTQKTIKGGGINSSIIENVSYKYNKSESLNSSFSLICARQNCGSKKFKQRTMKISTKLDNWWKPDIFDNTTFFFTCVKCGKIEVLSTDITIESSTSSSSSLKSTKSTKSI